MLAVLGLLTSGDPALGLIFGIGAVVLGVVGILEVRRSKVLAPMAIAGLALGSAVSVLALLVLAASLVPEQRDYQRCRDIAITHAATAACDQEFKDRSPFGMGA